MTILITLAALAVLLSGCFLSPGEELYSLPKPPEDYLDLQSCIDELLAGGGEYSGPVSGNNQQAVQLIDLDGDGVQEALAFMSVTQERPLRAYLFRKNGEGKYEQAASIDGDGSAFDTVEYVDMDGDGDLEMVLGRQVSQQVLQYMTVYSFSGTNTVTAMASGSYTEYKICDIDGDGASEMLLFKLENAETAGTADYFDFRNGELTLINTAQLSLGMESLKRIKSSSYIEGRLPAVFVSGTFQATGVITDVFAVENDLLKNVTIPEGAETSIQTIRNYIIYPSDVDGDGITELARPTQMPVFDENATETYYSLDWYSQTIDGQWISKISTYHNYSESWFFIIPEQWKGSISVSRVDIGDQGRALTFYRITDSRPEAIMTIMALTGDERETEAQKGSRFTLAARSDVIYAAEISDDSRDWEYMLSQEEIIENFKTIRTEWNTGEIK